MTEENEERLNIGEGESAVSGRFSILLLLGFALIVIGIGIVILASVFSDGTASFGGFIFIGPFPIVFGAGPSSIWLVAIAIATVALSIIMFVILHKKV